MRKFAIGAVAIAIVPSLMFAQADTARMHGRDTTRHRTMQSSAGAIGRRSFGLTRDQISQLQTALQQANCNPGPIDGVLGPRTRSAMACARQKNNVTGNNPNDLLRALNLNFTAPDSTGMGGVMRHRGLGRTSSDTTMRGHMRGDTTRRHTTRKGSPTRPDTSRSQ